MQLLKKSVTFLASTAGTPTAAADHNQSVTRDRIIFRDRSTTIVN